jgi:hypothetical protein
VASREDTDQGPEHEATARGQAFEPSYGSRRVWTRGSPRVSTRVSSVSLSVLPSAGADPPRSGELGGGDEETRTPDPLLAKEMLCQLSYVPAGHVGRRGKGWWAFLDSNQRPLPYQGSALTS